LVTNAAPVMAGDAASAGAATPRQTNCDGKPKDEADVAPASDGAERSAALTAGADNRCVDADGGIPRWALSPLRLAWIEFLGRWDWHWFCTFTFDPKHARTPQGLVHPEKTIKAYRFFVNSLDCSLFGKNWKRHGEGVFSVLALEPHKSGIVHLHALMGAVVNLNEVAMRVEWKEWWFKHFGIARIEEPKDAGDVGGYCTKYVSKGGELVLSDSLRPMAVQRGLDLRSGRIK
jgi:hypothetical protein